MTMPLPAEEPAMPDVKPEPPAEPTPELDPYTAFVTDTITQINDLTEALLTLSRLVLKLADAQGYDLDKHQVKGGVELNWNRRPQLVVPGRRW